MKLEFDRWGETILGAVVAVAAIGFFAFAAAQAGQTGPRDGYDLYARFQRVNGISIGSDVRIAGVKVGAVRAIELDENYFARLTLTIDRAVQIPDGSGVRVESDALLGGAYIGIEPGSLEPLEPGAEIIDTQSSVDLFSLLSALTQGDRNNSQNEATSP